MALPAGEDTIAFDWHGHTVRVTRATEHPENYLWLDIDGSRYFLGVLTKGMTRRDVKVKALEWLRDHADVTSANSGPM